MCPQRLPYLHMATKRVLLLLLGFGLATGSGCDPQDAPDDNEIERACESAVASLQRCVETVPDDFAESCTLITTTEELDEMLAVADTQCEPIPGKADLTDDAFEHACAVAVTSAAYVMRFRNQSQYVELTDAELDLYREQFEHVDDVHFYFDAGLLDEWTIAGFEVQLGFDVAGQAFGNRIYVEKPHAPGDEAQQRLVAHELQHSAQYVDRGSSMYQFALDYCAAFADSGFDYHDNALEQEARSEAAAFAKAYQ